MAVRSWHVGDVIRKLRQQHGLTATSLAQKAGVPRSVVVSLERQGPEIEGITPSQWRALDRVAAVLGLTNGASLYKHIPEVADLGKSTGPNTSDRTASRVLKFTRK